MPRTLSREEFDAIKQHVMEQAPSGLSKEEFERAVTPVFDGAIAKAENSSPGVTGSTLGRLAAGAWSMLNPVSMVQGVASAIRHPVDTASAIIGAQGEQFSKAADLAKQGRYLEAGGHAVAGAVPLVGPAAANAGEQIAAGDVAGGLGAGAGLLAPFAVKPALSAVRAAAPAGLRATIAESMEAGANRRVADVMSPKVGPNKTRFGNMAEKVAPKLAQDLAADGAPVSRSGFQQQVQSKLAEAESALDDAASARNPNQVVHTTPVLKALQERRAALTAETHKIGSFKAGESVVPSPNAARVAEIDKAIDEVKSLGPVANYEALRRIRQAYDGPAKAVYSPSMTADYIKAQGGKLGAADVTGVLREQLAAMDPQTAAANANYSLYRTADDVLTATAEVERTRPKVGRQIIARMAGTLLGSNAAGVPGAVAGYIAGPLVDSALSSGATTQLKTAALMTKLAAAIRRGDVSGAHAFSSQIKALVPSAARATGRLTSPNVFAQQPAPATGASQ